MFQSTRPRGARHPSRHPISLAIWFQSTRPRGARLLVCFASTFQSCFNPRAREGRDGMVAMPRGGQPGRFNPRAREGRDSCNSLNDSTSCLFQSTRPRGARQQVGRVIVGNVAFQSTRPRGARPYMDSRGVGHVGVSIHAPARGATTSMRQKPNASMFQSTRPRGARPPRLP